MSASKLKFVLFSALAAIVVLLDQWTKILARRDLRPLPWGASKVVVPGFFDLRYSENTGVAFGMFQRMENGRFVLTAIAVAAFALVVWYLHRSDNAHRRLHVALGLVGGGAIGNVIDRVMYGRVTDFIVWHYRGFEWPAFNIADAALVVGVGLMAIDVVRPPKPSDSKAAAEPASGGGSSPSVG